MKRVGLRLDDCIEPPLPPPPPPLLPEASLLRFSWRVMMWMLEVVCDANVGWSGGTKTPSWRNVLMLERRMGDEADGERRMIGSGRRELPDDDDMPGFLGRARPAEGAGTMIPPLPELILLLPGGYWPREPRLRPRNISAVLRMCEKSYFNMRNTPLSEHTSRLTFTREGRGEGEIKEHTVGLIPRRTVFRSPNFRSPL